ncbi:hypothetical protein GO011_09135 [Mycobacterium sp. 20091114027_K0903767]|nr:hypothetical protein [Mycobacterium sp. 20091114027_K0903767]
MSGSLALLAGAYMMVVAVVLDESRLFHVALSVMFVLGGLLTLRSLRKSRVD